MLALLDRDAGWKRYWDEREELTGPRTLPWELPGAHDDGPISGRSLPRHDHRKQRAHRRTRGTGLAGAGVAGVLIEAGRVADFVQGRGGAPVFSILAGVVMVAAFGFVIWRLVKGRRDRD